SDIVPLPIQRRWIVRFPKSFEDGFVGNFRGIKSNLDYLRMTGVTFAHLFVSRILHVPTRVTTGDRFDSRQHLKHRFSAPETAATERSQFNLIGGIHGF